MNIDTESWNQRAILRDALKNQVITVIGAGHMGSALIRGLIAAGLDPLNLWATAKTKSGLEALKKELGIHISTTNETPASKADILILAVKPKMLTEVMQELSHIIESHKPMIISVAAGISELNLREHISKQPIIRAMPNTPITIREGVTALFANNFVTDRQKKVAQTIFDAVGKTVWLEDESEIDLVTALSGSGPVYTFKLLQAMEEAAVAEGLSKETAKALATQTTIGSAKMAQTFSKTMKELCKEVASPGGGTEQALNVLEKEKINKTVHKALSASLKRYREISNA